MNVVPLRGHAVASVQKRTRLSPKDAAIYFPVVERELFYRGEDDDRIGSHLDSAVPYYQSPDHKQLLRDDGKVPLPLAVVGENYKVVQNEELFEAIEQGIIEKLPPDKLEHIQVTDRMSFGGAVSMREYIFHDIVREIETPTGFEDTNIGFRAIVINGFGASAVKIILGAIDFFCLNGMIIGVSDRKVRKHTSGLNVTALSNYIAGNLKLFDKNADRWCEWAKHGLTDDQAHQFFDALVEDKYLSERLSRRLHLRYRREKSTRGGTLWALVSALTYYSSHSNDDDGFGVRDTGKDHEAATLIKRSEDVRAILNSQLFARLAA